MIFLPIIRCSLAFRVCDSGASVSAFFLRYDCFFFVVKSDFEVVLFVRPSMCMYLMSIQTIHHIVIRTLGILASGQRCARIGFPVFFSISVYPGAQCSVTWAIIHLKNSLLPMEEGVEAALSSIDAAAVSSIKLEGRWQSDCY
jgi:hypothetical protein